MYMKVLKSDPRNIWAANGVGMLYFDFNFGISQSHFHFHNFFNAMFSYFVANKVVCWRIKAVLTKLEIYSRGFAKPLQISAMFG